MGATPSQRVDDRRATPAAQAFERRRVPALAIADDAERVARACHDMARRFHGGGTLLVFGNGEHVTDAQHIAVEFVHPVIVGKRALPATALVNDAATMTAIARDQGAAEVFAHQIRCLASPNDIALGVSSDGEDPAVLRGLEVAKEAGLLTIALTGGSPANAIASSGKVDHAFVVVSDDPLVIKEIHVTTYHVLWELVHVFFEQPGVLGPGLVR